jgi:cytochrome c oxidase subunit 2
LETVWTVTPALILATMFVLGLRTMSAVYASMGPSTAESGLRVEVVGFRYWWEYRYLDVGGTDEGKVVTANELHLPVGQAVRLEITAGDVLHDFWVPQLGWKRDAITGKVNVLPARLDRAGVYDGICTNYCGLQHAWMRIRVAAESQDQFDAWLNNERQPARAPDSDLALQGQQVFLRNTCVNCHVVAGHGAHGKVGPNLTHFGSRSLLGAGVLENTPENLRRWVQNAQGVKPGVLMPSYTTLPAQDIDALVAYLQSLK